MANSESENSEEALIALSQKGDQAAYTELINRYRRKIFSLCYGIVHDVEIAQDITQETFIKAYTHLPEFKKESKFYTWIYRIAFNACLNFIKKKPGLISEGSLTEFAYTTDAGQAFAERHGGAVDELEHKEIQELIEKGLQSLRPPHREVLQLFDIEGLSHAEIARKLGLKEGTVRSRLHYARQALREYLKKRLA